LAFGRVLLADSLVGSPLRHIYPRPHFLSRSTRRSARPLGGGAGRFFVFPSRNLIIVGHTLFRDGSQPLSPQGTSAESRLQVPQQSQTFHGATSITARSTAFPAPTAWLRPRPAGGGSRAVFDWTEKKRFGSMRGREQRRSLSSDKSIPGRASLYGSKT
jgi:hypothetical protein